VRLKHDDLKFYIFFQMIAKLSRLIIL